MSPLVAYVDGGSLGNPGPSGIGVVIDGSDGGKIRIAKWIGHQDNNVAEYVALLEALQCALTLNATILHVYSDSQIVVRQMTGAYTCRSPRLYSLNWTCQKLARTLAFSISHISREHNTEANGLANSAARKQDSGESLSGCRGKIDVCHGAVPGGRRWGEPPPGTFKSERILSSRMPIAAVWEASFLASKGGWTGLSHR
jgi:ribonuclease HI